MKKIERHGFISFWLWFCTIMNGLMSVVYFLLLFSSKGLWTATPDPMWQRIATIFCSLLVLYGFIMLLGWKKQGFYIVLASQIICLPVTCITAPQTLLMNIVSAIIGLGLLYAILQIKKNDMSYWEAMDNAVAEDSKELNL